MYGSLFDLLLRMRSLGISTIFVHRYASILSAYGLFLAEVAEEAQEPAASSLDMAEHQASVCGVCVCVGGVGGGCGCVCVFVCVLM